MGFLALSEVFTAEGRDAVVASVLSGASKIKLKVTAWQEGQPIRELLILVSQKMADTQALMAEAIKGGLLDYAEGGWLTLLAQSLYRVTRIEARAATDNSMTITNASGVDLGTFQPGALVFAHAITGKTYRNTNAVTLGVGAALTGQLIYAEEAGTGSDAAPGAISVLVTSIDGVSCSNVNAVLGVDAELDPDLRTRCRNKLGSLSPNGPKEAYAYVATTPELAAVSVPITRTELVLDEVTGFLTLFLATAVGAPSVDDVTVVDDALDVWATPWCATADAAACSELVVPVSYAVWIKGSSLTVPQIENAIATALARAFRELPIGGFKIPPAGGLLYVGNLEQVIGTATPGIFKVTVALPAANVPIDEGQIAKLGTITPSVTVVA